ncbi:hypothetical protein FSARC_6601 [Fusarium sarcochroum]|uniref:Alcohol dehydrogenase-like C-terminal domain-containing protein n=1 Tax=Fusarium sarcochroum TaxID=1208366 RepID=A0A8H4X950_9HYPO|nr:hypothetical protein FSARC_6601 [Fusarium sarcochroum]
MSTPIPKQHRALFLSTTDKPLTIETRNTPEPGPGSVLVRILATSVRTNTPDVLQSSVASHGVPTSFVPGFISIGRVASVGPDTTKLSPRQLVFFNPWIVGRDSRDASCVSGLMEGFNEASHKLSHGEWRDSTFAEYAKLPLENCHVLNESRLFKDPKDGGLGYTLEDLTHLFSMLIPFGGLADIDIKSGETVVIAPATGRYGSAAARVALAMGARVIAIGRNASILSQLEAISPQLDTVQMTNDIERDTQALRSVIPEGADAFWDMSPPGASNSTHFRSSLNVLKHGARVSIMGFIPSGVSFSYMDILAGGLSIKGTQMCTQDQTRRLINMVESGVLPLARGARMGPVRMFKLEQWEECFAVVRREIGPGEIVIAP